jgi:hypothetical protein
MIRYRAGAECGLNRAGAAVTMRPAGAVFGVDGRDFTTFQADGRFMEQISIRLRVRQMLETGALPCDEHGKVWAGRGVGTHCVACGESIAPTDVEFEVELPSGPPLRLHRVCHRIWREECDALLPR